MSLALQINDLERRCIAAESELEMIHSLCVSSSSKIIFYTDQSSWTPVMDALSKLMIKAGIDVEYKKSKDSLGVISV